MVKRGRGRLSAGFLFSLFFFSSPPARVPEGSRSLGRPAPADAADAATGASSCYYMCGGYCCSPRAPGASPVPHGSQLEPLPQEPAEGLGQRPGVPEQKVEVEGEGVEVELEDGLPRLELHGLHPRQ